MRPLNLYRGLFILKFNLIFCVRLFVSIYVDLFVFFVLI